MAEMAHGAHSEESGTRRDFLTLATAATGAVGAACAIWPFVDSMNPAADTLALSTTEAALDNIAEGMAVKVMWRGKPVFIRHRTADEINEASLWTLRRCQIRSRILRGSKSRNGWFWSVSAPTSAVFPSAPLLVRTRATLMAGSAPATVRIMIRPDVFGRARHRGTWSCRPIRSLTTPIFALVEASKNG